jgi:K+-transporting ATPase A subunit
MSYVPAVLLACWGAWENRRAWRRWVLVALPILYFAAVHCVFVGSIRYRQPAMPFILVFSAVGLWSLVAKLARHGRAASAAAGRTAGTV